MSQALFAGSLPGHQPNASRGFADHRVKIINYLVRQGGGEPA